MRDADAPDVVVIGAGGAGLAAAVAAADEGARVLVFESEGEPGGSTRLSAGMFTAGGTSVQAALGVEDSPERLFQHYMDLNRWGLRPGVVRAFCDEAAPTLEWLLGLGLEVPATFSANANQPGLGQGGVGDVWRAHTPRDQGYGLIDILDKQRRKRGAELVLHTRVERLIAGGGQVTGVIADGIEVETGAVVIAAGGHSHDEALLEKYYPRALEAGDSLFAVAAPGSRGDHIRLGDQVHAAVAGAGQGLLLLTAYFQRHHHWQAGFPPKSRVYVDRAGRRFVNEDVSYAVSTGIFDQHGGWAWSIFDETARKSLPPGYMDWDPGVILREAEAGRTHRADSLEALARQIDVPAETLKFTVDEWNRHLPQGKPDTEFMRHVSLADKGFTDPLDAISEPPFYAVRMLPGELVCTHAGLEITGSAQVVDRGGRRIAGLFAAGESGGGILGENYVGAGNAVANAVTMGRVAGINAARFARGH
ncbi:MAG TPA: FAD-dependent oxidoreductase [Amycolatopsis sp.]|nr:FAD-dependent oxidoreductase [Amycolatopsis sp.]